MRSVQSHPKRTGDGRVVQFYRNDCKQEDNGLPPIRGLPFEVLNNNRSLGAGGRKPTTPATDWAGRWVKAGRTKSSTSVASITATLRPKSAIQARAVLTHAPSGRVGRMSTKSQNTRALQNRRRDSVTDLGTCVFQVPPNLGTGPPTGNRPGQQVPQAIAHNRSLPAFLSEQARAESMPCQPLEVPHLGWLGPVADPQ